jgi:hypothetical protein
LSASGNGEFRLLFSGLPPHCRAHYHFGGGRVLWAGFIRCPFWQGGKTMIKTIQEWEQVIHPGRRIICNLPSGAKKGGVAGYLHSSTGVEPIVQFDTGEMVYITEKVLHFFQVDQ